jgi:DNA primase
VTSDRWWAYAHLPLARRQLCWAHLKRDFAAHAEGLAAEKEFGEHGLKLCERVFWAWEIFQNTNDRSELKRTIRGLQRDFKPIIARYASKRARNKYCRGMARNLIKAWPALCQLRRSPQGRADQQPRRARTPLSGHLPQALPRHPVRGRRTPHPAAPLRAHDLPAARTLPLRLPHRRAHSPRPRRPHSATHLSSPTN